MIKAKPIHDINKIKELVEYYPDTGIIKWRVNRKGPAKAGMVAGAKHGRGYIILAVDNVSYLAHRLAWAIHYGSISEDMQIDHINGDRSDNRICNLRIATHAENCRNSRARKHNKSGIKGVRKMRSKWSSRLRINGKEIWLGSYNTPEEAKQAHDTAAVELFGEFAENKRRPS
jgi:hypothetical protein